MFNVSKCSQFTVSIPVPRAWVLIFLIQNPLIVVAFHTDSIRTLSRSKLHIALKVNPRWKQIYFSTSTTQSNCLNSFGEFRDQFLLSQASWLHLQNTDSKLSKSNVNFRCIIKGLVNMNAVCSYGIKAIETIWNFWL